MGSLWRLVGLEVGIVGFEGGGGKSTSEELAGREI